MKPSPLFQEKPQIFAYLRRSTKKEEQEMSLEKQLDSIPFILEEMGLSMADITKSFSDSFTGYKIKTIEGRPQVKRPGFRELVKTVREQKVPCIILAFNPSRLTRNVPDGTTIKEFLGHHENKQKVQYIRFFGGVVWDKNTPATTIDAEVSKAVAYSERLAQDKINNILTSLKSNRLPATIKTPPGLKAAREGLLETEKMPFIHRAFEMKANGETGESIEKYLKQNNSYIKAGNLKKYFSNSIYIGKYFYERNEVEYEVKFVKKKVAIPMELWNQVQHRLGKKGSGYGEFQENDVLRKVIKIRGDDGEVIGGMTGYEGIDEKTGKRKARQYKSSTLKQFNISEVTFLKSFIEIIDKVCFVWLRGYFQETIPETEKGLQQTLRNFPCYDNNGNPQLDKEDLEDIKKRVAYGRHILYLLSATNSLKDFHKKAPEFPLQDFFGFANMEIVNEKKNKLQHHNAIFQETLDSDKESKEALARWGIDFHKISENWKNLVEEEIDKTALSIRLSNRVIQEALKQTELAKQKKAEWEGQKSNIGILKRDYNRIEEEIVDIMSGAFMAKVTDRVMIDRLTAKKRKELEETQILIDEYSKLDEVSQYIEMLPEILSKTFELATSALRLRKIKEAREDILKLIEICTFELSVNTKKELKVKLFDTLDGVFILNGGRYRIRTYDPLRVKQML